MSVRTLLLTMDDQEIGEWMAFFELEKQSLDLKKDQPIVGKPDMKAAKTMREKFGHMVKRG